MNIEGRLLLNGQLTAWEKDDLIETGRTVPRDLAEGLVEDPAMMSVSPTS